MLILPGTSSEKDGDGNIYDQEISYKNLWIHDSGKRDNCSKKTLNMKTVLYIIAILLE